MLLLSVAPAPTPRDGRAALLGGFVLMLAGVLSGWTLLVADARIRTNWPYFDAGEHWAGALGLYAAIGALLGLLLFGIIALEDWIVGRRLGGRGPWRTLLRCTFYGMLGGVSSISTAIWTFSGEKAQESPLSVAGPIAFASACALSSGLGAWLLMTALVSLHQNRLGWAPIALGFLTMGVGITHVDLTWYVALYSRIHTLLEVTAAFCLGAAYALCLVFLTTFELPRRVVSGLGIATGVWLLSCLGLSAVRTWFDEKLRHVWLEEVYVGRMLRRIQVVEAYLSNPFEWRGMQTARLTRLKKRYDLRDLSVAQEWDAPLAEPPEIWDALRKLRGGQKRHNVLVYYVDTLRADVTSDPKLMPGLARFRSKSLDFQRAYATGSDTLRSLPALTGGNYDVFQTPPNDILRVARHADYESVLISAKSAYEFLDKLRPEFDFDQRLIVSDYPAEQKVWGYGAQRPTAPAIVDRALQYLDRSHERPFFLWLFNFDQHNWRELDSDYIAANARRFGIVDDPELLAYRYRVVARAIDREFERLVTALQERNLLDQTIVLFVSDHGEALGRDGFWVHSVFLWESLIRVPLVLRVPGLEPAAVDEKVSLVDVAPTLGRFMDPTLDGRGFHGEDLLGHLLPEPPARRFPLLLLSASKDYLVRVGLVDPVEEFKLVLSFEAALPELYDLRIPDPDAANFAGQYPERTRRALAQLVRSPVFPRSGEDFDVRDTKEQKGLVAPCPPQGGVCASNAAP